MADSTTLLKLVAVEAARPPRPRHRLDLHSLAIAAQTTDAWYIFLVFRYDTAEEGGIPGSCSIVLPEAEEEEVLAILSSGLELGGYRIGHQINLMDLTELLGAKPRRFAPAPKGSHDVPCLARVITADESYDISIKGSIIELRGNSSTRIEKGKT